MAACHSKIATYITVKSIMNLFVRNSVGSYRCPRSFHDH